MEQKLYMMLNYEDDSDYPGDADANDKQAGSGVEFGCINSANAHWSKNFGVME